MALTFTKKGRLGNQMANAIGNFRANKGWIVIRTHDHSRGACVYPSIFLCLRNPLYSVDTTLPSQSIVRALALYLYHRVLRALPTLARFLCNNLNLPSFGFPDAAIHPEKDRNEQRCLVTADASFELQQCRVLVRGGGGDEKGWE